MDDTVAILGVRHGIIILAARFWRPLKGRTSGLPEPCLGDVHRLLVLGKEKALEASVHHGDEAVEQDPSDALVVLLSALLGTTVKQIMKLL